MGGRIFLWFLCVGLLWGGGQNSYTALTNPTITNITCAEVAKQKPKASWLKLEECEYNLTEATHVGALSHKDLLPSSPDRGSRGREDPYYDREPGSKALRAR